MSDRSGLQIFLCHANEDKKIVRDLYTWLQNEGHHPWMDEEDILPGQNWLLAIHEAIRESHVFLVCLTPNSSRKTGVVQREIKLAIDAATERPDDDIYIIPSRLTACEVPNGLRHWHWVDLFEDRGRERLSRSLARRAEELVIVPSSELATGSPTDDDSIEDAGDGLGEAFEWIMHVAGTSARNAVGSIHEGHQIRRGRMETEDRVEWLVGAMEEKQKTLEAAEGPVGDGMVAQRLRVIGMATDFAASSFSKALKSIREFSSFEGDVDARERYVLDRLDLILAEWENYGLDRPGDE